MFKINVYIKKADHLLQDYSKRYFLYRKLSMYKEKLQQYKHFNLKAIRLYEKRWRHLNQRYSRIVFHDIQFVSLGETIFRLFNLLEDMNRENKGVLHVVVPTFFDNYAGGIYNRRIFDLFGKKVYFIKDSNIDFWTYVFCAHTKDMDMAQFNRYVPVRLEPTKINLGELLLPFSKTEIAEGEEKLHKMGVNGEFICIHARESGVKAKNFGGNAGYNSSCRNCDIDTFMKASKYFAGHGLLSVRLGKYEVKECNQEFVIDYANKYYDEFMDFYLLSRCKFLISCDTGVASICGYWGRPVLMTNMINVCYGAESWPDTGYCMYLPKKFYSKKVKRYLNLYETLDMMEECYIYTSNFDRQGIRLEDNTEDEILAASRELNDRIDGIWKETEEEKKIMEKYWKIMHRWNAKHKKIKIVSDIFGGYRMCISRPCYSFLKDNLYLLDVEDVLLQ